MLLKKKIFTNEILLQLLSMKIFFSESRSHPLDRHRIIDRAMSPTKKTFTGISSYIPFISQAKKKKKFYLIGPFPVELCKISFIKMLRYFDFQIILLHALISLLLHFLIYNALNCLSV